MLTMVTKMGWARTVAQAHWYSHLSRVVKQPVQASNDGGLEEGVCVGRKNIGKPCTGQ